jgi:hypothetical protein
LVNKESKIVFTQFNSAYKRKKFYENELGFIKPEEILLKTTCTAPNNNSGDMIIKSSFGYYIPFEKSLTNTLKSIPPHIDINFNQNNKKFKNDFFGGNFVKTGLQPDDNKFAILLYSDDLELTNAVGSSRTKHKLSIVFSFIIF